MRVYAGPSCGLGSVWFSKRGKSNGLMTIHQRIAGHLQTLVFLNALCAPLVLAQDDSVPATISIDASKVEGNISPILYGQFDEFMFEDVKGGLYAELIRDRSFDEAPNALGLPRYWERDPDDRNDDDALHFSWDASVYFPVRSDANTLPTQHSLRVDI